MPQLTIRSFADDWRMDVADDTGKVIYRFSFKAEEL
jgi:hypothetical protein